MWTVIGIRLKFQREKLSNGLVINFSVFFTEIWDIFSQNRNITEQSSLKYVCSKYSILSILSNPGKTCVKEKKIKISVNVIPQGEFLLWNIQ